MSAAAHLVYERLAQVLRHLLLGAELIQPINRIVHGIWRQARVARLRCRHRSDAAAPGLSAPFSICSDMSLILITHFGSCDMAAAAVIVAVWATGAVEACSDRRSQNASHYNLT